MEKKQNERVVRERTTLFSFETAGGVGYRGHLWGGG